MCLSVVSHLGSGFLDRLSICWLIYMKKESFLKSSHCLIPRFTEPSSMASLLLPLLFLLMPSPSLLNLAHLPCLCLPVSCQVLAILCPCHFSQAVPGSLYTSTVYFSQSICHTFRYNLLDWFTDASKQVEQCLAHRRHLINAC